MNQSSILLPAGRQPIPDRLPEVDGPDIVRVFADPDRSEPTEEGEAARLTGHEDLLKVSTILVPLQFDARSRLLLIMASSLAAQLKARLVLLHGYQKKNYAPAHCGPKQFENTNLSLQRQAEARMEGLKSSFAGIEAVRDARSLVTDGDLEIEIPRVAVAINASLVLLSTHAYSGLRRLLLGCKADAILRRSPCPVLVIPDLPLFENLQQAIEISRPRTSRKASRVAREKLAHKGIE